MEKLVYHMSPWKLTIGDSQAVSVKCQDKVSTISFHHDIYKLTHIDEAKLTSPRIFNISVNPTLVSEVSLKVKKYITSVIKCPLPELIMMARFNNHIFVLLEQKIDDEPQVMSRKRSPRGIGQMNLQSVNPNSITRSQVSECPKDGKVVITHLTLCKNQTDGVPTIEYRIAKLSKDNTNTIELYTL